MGLLKLTLKFAAILAISSFYVISAQADDSLKDLVACAGLENQIAQNPTAQIKLNQDNALFINAGWPWLDEAATAEKDANGLVKFSPVDHEGNYAELTVDFSNQQLTVLDGATIHLAQGNVKHCEGSVLQDGKCILGSYTEKVVCAVYVEKF